MEAEEAVVPSYEDIVGAHDDEDDAYDEQADQFEAAYNFRFEVSILQLLLMLNVAVYRHSCTFKQRQMMNSHTFLLSRL